MVVEVHWKLDGELRVTERVLGYDLEPVYELNNPFPVTYRSVQTWVEVETVLRDPDEIRAFFRRVR